MNQAINLIKNMNKILLTVIILIIVVRIFLPIALKVSINWYLGNKIESYEGHIEDFDLSLYRGAYQIQGLDIWKKGADKNLPLVHAGEIDLSLAWRALFHGKLLGDLDINQMKLNFVDSDKKNQKQFGGEEKNWNEVVSKLIPINIESLKITDSEVHFVNRDYVVPVDLHIDRLNLKATNLRNIDREDVLLPSHARIEGRLQGNADFLIKGQLNLLRKPIAFNLDAEVKDFSLSKLNDFFLVYGPFTFTRGKLSLYSEVATKDANIKGYVKPFFEDVKMIANREHFISAKHGLYEILLGTGNLILRSPGGKEAATRLKFEGSMKSPDFDIWGAVTTALKNAFGESLKPGIDKSIDIQSVPVQ